MKVEIFVNAAVSRLNAFLNVDAMFIVREEDGDMIVHYKDDLATDIEFGCEKRLQINGKAMRLNNTELFQDDPRYCANVNSACREAFLEHFKGEFSTTEGNSITSCMTLSEDGISPRADSSVGNYYVSVWCDESPRNDRHSYLVAMTPHNQCIDGFDIRVVEATPFEQHLWCATYEEAIAIYKTFLAQCVERIS